MVAILLEDLVGQESTAVDGSDFLLPALALPPDLVALETAASDLADVLVSPTLALANWPDELRVLRVLLFRPTAREVVGLPIFEDISIVDSADKYNTSGCTWGLLAFFCSYHMEDKNKNLQNPHHINHIEDGLFCYTQGICGRAVAPIIHVGTSHLNNTSQLETGRFQSIPLENHC